MLPIRNDEGCHRNLRQFPKSSVCDFPGVVGVVILLLAPAACTQTGQFLVHDFYPTIRLPPQPFHSLACSCQSLSHF